MAFQAHGTTGLGLPGAARLPAARDCSSDVVPSKLRLGTQAKSWAAPAKWRRARGKAPLAASGAFQLRAAADSVGADVASSEAVIDVIATSESSAERLLGGLSFISAATGKEVPALSLWDRSNPNAVALLCFLTHFGDLTTAEYAQLIVRKILPEIGAEAAAAAAGEGSAPNVSVAAVGLGSVENARKFADLLGFPLDLVFCDPSGAGYKALGFSPGFAPEVPVSPYLKLFPMLAGIGSPGTIQEVLRGYVGDRKRSPVFEDTTPFDVLGKGYQRPFELATQRLFNMGTVLSNWPALAPAQESLLTQQGGTIIFKGGEDIFFHKDSGILMYANVDDVLKTLKDVSS